MNHRRVVSYTLMLTGGPPLSVTPEAAAAIRAAILAGDKLVEVDVQLFSGSDSVRRTTIVAAHVTALSEALETYRSANARASAETGGKVRAIR